MGGLRDGGKSISQMFTIDALCLRRARNRLLRAHDLLIRANVRTPRPPVGPAGPDGCPARQTGSAHRLPDHRGRFDEFCSSPDRRHRTRGDGPQPGPEPRPQRVPRRRPQPVAGAGRTRWSRSSATRASSSPPPTCPRFVAVAGAAAQDHHHGQGRRADRRGDRRAGAAAGRGRHRHRRRQRALRRHPPPRGRAAGEGPALRRQPASPAARRAR